VPRHRSPAEVLRRTRHGGLPAADGDVRTPATDRWRPVGMEAGVIVPAITFVVFLAGVLAAYWFFVVRPEQKSLGIVRRRMSTAQAVKGKLQRELVKQEQSLSSIAVFDAVLRRSK